MIQKIWKRRTEHKQRLKNFLFSFEMFLVIRAFLMRPKRSASSAVKSYAESDGEEEVVKRSLENDDEEQVDDEEFDSEEPVKESKKKAKKTKSSASLADSDKWKVKIRFFLFFVFVFFFSSFFFVRSVPESVFVAPAQESSASIRA